MSFNLELAARVVKTLKHLFEAHGHLEPGHDDPDHEDVKQVLLDLTGGKSIDEIVKANTGAGTVILAVLKILCQDVRPILDTGCPLLFPSSTEKANELLASCEGAGKIAPMVTLNSNLPDTFQKLKDCIDAEIQQSLGLGGFISRTKSEESEPKTEPTEAPDALQSPTESKPPESSL